ncbi:Zn-dependent hydrolase [Natribacillus halophilus]|uniref:N-carbamoyl-L-amino-acid hydrolase n=1 Tax=Natribacillus halophilus TaxID=549003 RepID=A0A1G8JYP4_9BACI|nr:Zn-dependent hydrolase [Natribacillus halophilus]SDI35670.1 N-carbamoyl-L-amino-acid hydrolase [Natribacillus halophilus]
MHSPTLQINTKRLLSTIAESSSIGSTANHGLHRLALTEEDRQVRHLFTQWLENEGLDVRIDDFGNIYGRREGRLKEAPPIVMGSHLDSQPQGGRYDGVLGVLTALEVIRVLNEYHIETEYPVEIVNFTNEEGARFSPPMLGSGGVTGNFSKDFIYNIQDRDGITFSEALKDIDYVGETSNRLEEISAYIELHIEQGPVLSNKGKSLGVVEGIQGMTWVNVSVEGKSNHAGSTPMDDRTDALVCAGQMIGKIKELTQEIKGLKTTVGRLDVSPNTANVVPGRVDFSIDIRHEDNEIRQHALQRLKEQLSSTSFIHGTEVIIHSLWNSDTIEFSPTIRNAIKTSADELDLPSLSLYSGAGHDSKYMHSMGETGMIFLPSERGISHNEDEFTHDDDIEKGARVLLQTLLKLDTTI